VTKYIKIRLLTKKKQKHYTKVHRVKIKILIEERKVKLEIKERREGLRGVLN